MLEDQEQRTHTVKWHDPAPALQAMRRMSGLEALKAMQSGELPPPPAIALIGIKMIEVSEGSVIFCIEPAEYHYNPLGTVHGGITATLLDSAMGCAVQSLLPAGAGYTTLEIKVNYVRPITVATGTVTCEGTCIHRGGRIAIAEGRVTDAMGKLYAHATTTCMLLRS